MMKAVIHQIYEVFGHVYAVLSSIYYSIRDSIRPPKERAVLFVAHPDDDVLFFHTFIKKEKPYVVLLTSGGVLKRIIPFCRAMHFYKVRYRTFDLHSRAIEKEELVSKRIKRVLNSASFKVCATHNNEGEYGHVMHCCIHRCVIRNWDGPTLVPYSKSEIVNHPLSLKEVEDKKKIIRKYYYGEYSTLQKLETWINNEGLININSNTILLNEDRRNEQQSIYAI